ncbi:hypothetical protein SUDANB105_03775 [Streptomyces sp. enrichment culture]
MIESVSARKTTRLGTGYFVTTRTDIRAGGEPAGTHRFRILKYAQGAGRAQGQMTGFHHGDLTGLPEARVVARQVWRRSGLGPADIDAGILCDRFTAFVLMQLEEYGCCGPGEAAGFVAEDRLPLNTHGGRLGEACLHGMNGVAEAVRQLRGTSPNQVRGAERVLVTAGTGCRRRDWCSPPTGEHRGALRLLPPDEPPGVNPQAFSPPRPPSGGAADPTSTT